MRFPSSKSLLYNCLHRNWIRAYAFANIALAIVYFIELLVKHCYPNLLHHSSINYYSLPLILLRQIFINFSTFHLFAIALSILQHFLRYHRLLRNSYLVNTYNRRNLLIAEHTNVALIVSGSLALIFGYNFIYYAPKHSQTQVLLPLITLNMILLPSIDFLIFLLVIVCCTINFYRYSDSLAQTSLLYHQQSQQLSSNLRSTVEKTTCTKCFSEFLQANRHLFQDEDPYTYLRARFLAQNANSSARASLASSVDRRKYSTVSFETIPLVTDAQARLRASFPCQMARSCLASKPNQSQQDCFTAQTTDERHPSCHDLIPPSTWLKLRRRRSLCHLCYCFLLVFLLKYALLTFPLHFIQMKIYLRQFHEFIIKKRAADRSSYLDAQIYRTILLEYSASTVAACRYSFLLARFGDSLLLTRLPRMIKKYLPCWCRFNSKSPRRQQELPRTSHQILVRNPDPSTSEPVAMPDMHNGHENDLQQHDDRRSTAKLLRRAEHRRFRVLCQCMPIWSNRRFRLFRENS